MKTVCSSVHDDREYANTHETAASSHLLKSHVSR